MQRVRRLVQLSKMSTTAADIASQAPALAMNFWASLHGACQITILFITVAILIAKGRTGLQWLQNARADPIGLFTTILFGLGVAILAGYVLGTSFDHVQVFIDTLTSRGPATVTSFVHGINPFVLIGVSGLVCSSCLTGWFWWRGASHNGEPATKNRKHRR